MKQAIYILSLEHSGSTLLSLAISAHPKVISFGEVDKVINASKNDISMLREANCLCGKTVHQCEFWGKVINGESLAQSQDDQAAYEIILRVFFSLYSGDCIFLDSSKIINNLSALINAQGVDAVKIIFLIKDVRSYAISSRANAKRYNTASRSVPSRIGLIKHWYLQNRAMWNFLNANNLDYLLIGYEELCLHTDLIMDIICEYLKIDYDPVMKDLSSFEGHHIFGNRMRKQPQKNVHILYDDRWLRDLRINQLLTFTPKAWRFNLDYVYSNTQNTLWHT